MEIVIPVIPSVTLVHLVRNEFLNKITCAAGIIDSTHCTASEEVAILKFLLLWRQSVSAEHIVETVEHNVVIESWVTVLVWMFWIPTRLRVQHQLSVSHEIDRLSVSHTVLVDQVGCRVVDDVIMVNETCHLRTEYLSTVPVRSVSVW